MSWTHSEPPILPPSPSFEWGAPPHLLALVLHLTGGSVAVAAWHRVERATHVDVVLSPRAACPAVVQGVPVAPGTALRFR